MSSELDVLVTWGALHQVWFVRNYFCLVFEGGQRLSVYCHADILFSDGTSIGCDAWGFSDSLTNCIEAGVKSLEYERSKRLDLFMSNNHKIRLWLDPSHASGPEAFEIQNETTLAPAYIEFNA